MPLACRHSEHWLRHTIKCWLGPAAARHVSTFSAIQRGLRATRDARDDAGDRDRDRDRGRKLQERPRTAASQRQRPAGTRSHAVHLSIERLGGRSSRRDASDRTPPARSTFSTSPTTPSPVQPQTRPIGRSQASAADVNSGGRVVDGETPPATEDVVSRVRRLANLLVSVRKLETFSPQDPFLQERLRQAQSIVSSMQRDAKTGQWQEGLVLDVVRRKMGRVAELWNPIKVPSALTYLHVGRHDELELVSRTQPGQQETDLEPDSGELLGRESPGDFMKAAAKRLYERFGRLADLIEEVRSMETEPGLNARAGTPIHEARSLVAQVNTSLSKEEWGIKFVSDLARKTLGMEDVRWSKSKTPGAHTYLHVGRNGKLTVVPAQRPRNNRRPDVMQKDAPSEMSPETQPEEQAKAEDDDIPVPIPHSTAASEFLYGSNTVLAALRARRRKLYHIYFHSRMSAREETAKSIRSLAKQLAVPTTENADLRLLDRVAGDRPHNGVVLEASRLPAPPLLALHAPDSGSSVVPLALDRQSTEELDVNGAHAAIPALTQSWRRPFVLMLDGITDPGNVGNILRTAHFYGVDAVAIATNTCAPLTSATLAKASSGACEALRIFTLPKPSRFVYDSKRAGWRIYAAVAPPAVRPKELRSPRDHERYRTTSAVALSTPLAKNPIILMLGAEGEGLRDNLKTKADHFVTIEQGKRAFDNIARADVGVDSLNVGVAAGVLVEAFMRRPEGVPKAGNMNGKVGELGF